MQKKPLIFLSHASTDLELATRIKDLIRKAFVEQIEVFLSDVDIQTGDSWRSKLMDKLRESQVLLLLATERSISRPWVNFEIGAFFALEKPVYPVLSPGLEKDQLPSTFNDIQYIQLDSVKSVDLLLQNMGKFTLGGKAAKVNTRMFLDFAINFEKRVQRRAELFEIIDKSKDILDRLPSWLSSCSYEGVLCGFHFQKSLSDHREFYKEAVMRGARLKIAYCDPDLPDLRGTAESFRMEYEELRLEVLSGEQILINLCREIKKLKPSKAGSITPIKLSRVPNARYYLFDREAPDGFVACTPYIDLRPAQTPTFVFGAGAPSAVQYAKACMELIEENGSVVKI
ncbi:toll/interleukin-1 receptor domain-containing protein [Luteolibacter ambystomatis]|uniref:Toll/interleukin-1 receptor domain-containing protein n=1 Tax=Luteolibacter ambystomatis TaxID=2824561 RepID=A0A975IXP2_9BACT|nr:toll/interleukin-1 receptor domain-containing protein [Luteolibacter ambystomatis]QUE49289.1 toll/interleukin-1 receptor domain-containing protein [Luteolibacter ambystomatis]